MHEVTPEGIRAQPESASGSKFSALTDDFRENTSVVVCCKEFSAVFGGLGAMWTPPSAPPYLTMYTPLIELHPAQGRENKIFCIS